MLGRHFVRRGDECCDARLPLEPSLVDHGRLFGCVEVEVPAASWLHFGGEVDGLRMLSPTILKR